MPKAKTLLDRLAPLLEDRIGLPDMYNWNKLVLRPDSRNPAEFSGQTPYEVYHDPDYGWSNVTPADLGYKRWKTWRKFEPERYYDSLEDY